MVSAVIFEVDADEAGPEAGRFFKINKAFS
jgi:hypothetical protein